ncbi:DMBT1-like protein [Mya arenaria]|uniref:Scavenger receptor cysteine-rich domain-containing protein DMBT1 n=1 Tax=Mya arenaria TaxID=6604 RepID=A0ABY7GCF7_MYAAR|nr:DMBT1-like protein [Mya arenaria]
MYIEVNNMHSSFDYKRTVVPLASASVYNSSHLGRRSYGGYSGGSGGVSGEISSVGAISPATRTAQLLRPECQGGEGNIEMCNAGTRFHSSVCSSIHAVGIDCNPQDASLREVRLVDGPGPWRGRLELRTGNGRWGSLCWDHWEPATAAVGYVVVVFTHIGKSVNASSFPALHGLTSMIGRSLTCNTSATNLGHCRLDYDVSACSVNHADAVGVDCSGGLSVTIGDNRTWSGEVTFHTGNGSRWSVCTSGLDQNSAAVVCTMAGFPNTRPVVSSVASQVPVLYSNVACDGWEGHVSQCSTLNTRAGCDEKAALDCFHGCVHYLNGMSGNVTSPSYPGYPDDSDCLYVITNAGHQPIKLAFSELALSGDGDSVEVTTGVGGHQLGYFTGNQRVPHFLATDGPMYIRFRSNQNGTAQGFRAEYSPLRLEDTLTLGCGPSGWDVAVNTSLLRVLHTDTGVSQVKLTDQFCTGIMDGDLIRFRQHYTECHTVSKTTPDNIVYHNELVYPEAASPFPIIVHGYRWKVRLIRSPSKYVPNPDTNPLYAREDVYVQVAVNTDDTHIKMRLDTCYARPDPSARPDLTYTLIKNGCVSDPYTHILSQGTHETRFVFNAFEFPQSHDSVYVYCNTTFCDTADSSVRCTQTCLSGPSIVGRGLASAANARTINNRRVLLYIEEQ